MGEFVRCSETEVWRGWAISAVEATFTDPWGATFQRDLIRHPGAVAVVAVDHRRQVTLVRQYRPAVETELWEIPAGTRDVTGEDPADTARRELAEEAGLVAEQLVELIRTHNSPGFCDQLTIIYLATGLSACPTDRRGTEEEFMTLVTVDLDDLEALVAEGVVVVDATTVLGLSLARARLAGPG